MYITSILIKRDCINPRNIQTVIQKDNIDIVFLCENRLKSDNNLTYY